MINQKGFGLVEAMIGLVVVTVGLLSINALHSNYIASLVDDRIADKANVIAMQHASKMRSAAKCTTSTSNYPVDQDGYTVEMSKNDPCDFTVSVKKSGTLYKQLNISLAEMGSQDLQDVPAFYDPEGGGFTYINMPFGEAEYGKDGEKITLTDDQKNAGDGINGDGTSVVVINDVRYLVDAVTEEVLLKQTGEVLNVIKGRVFVNKTYISKTDAGKIFVGAPDVSVCRTLNAEEDLTVVVDTEGDETNYIYSDYACYFGNGWYGSLGPILVDDAVNPVVDNTCVGDPGVTETSSYFSNHVQESITRTYLGYKAVAVSSESIPSHTLALQGVQSCDDTDGDGLCEVYSEHDFLIDEIKGSNTCDVQMDVFNAVAVTDGGLDDDAPGKRVCLENSNICPDEATSPYASKMNSFSINPRYQLDGGPITGFSNSAEFSNAVVLAKGFADESTHCESNGTYYECAPLVAGAFDGNEVWVSKTSWSGAIQITLPDGSNYCDAGDEDKIFIQSFDVESGDVEPFVMQFITCGDGSSCLTGPQWEGATDSTKQLKWTSSCDSVVVYECSVANKNTLTACDPSEVDTAPESAASPLNVSPENKETICYEIEYTDSDVTQTSSTFCKHQKNGVYTFQ